MHGTLPPSRGTPKRLHIIRRGGERIATIPYKGELHVMWPVTLTCEIESLICEYTNGVTVPIHLERLLLVIIGEIVTFKITGETP